MSHHLLWYYLFFAPRVFLVGILLVLWRGKHFRQHPVFFAYITYEIVQFPFDMYMIFASISDYRFLEGHTLLLAGSIFLRFGVIYELFQNLSKTYPVLARFSKTVFRSLIVIFLLISVGLIASSWPGTMHGLNLFTTFVLDRGVNMLQLGLLLGLFGIAKSFGLSWRKHVFGITLGLAIYLGVQLIATAVQSEWGYLRAFDYITMAAFHVSVVIWLFYVLIPEPKTMLAVIPEHSEMADWNNELEKLVQPK
jgi:hypothetical protein